MSKDFPSKQGWGRYLISSPGKKLDVVDPHSVGFYVKLSFEFSVVFDEITYIIICNNLSVGGLIRLLKEPLLYCVRS